MCNYLCYSLPEHRNFVLYKACIRRYIWQQLRCSGKREQRHSVQLIKFSNFLVNYLCPRSLFYIASGRSPYYVLHLRLLTSSVTHRTHRNCSGDEDVQYGPTCHDIVWLHAFWMITRIEVASVLKIQDVNSTETSVPYYQTTL